MVNILLSVWRGVFDFFINMLEYVRSLISDNKAKAIHPGATKFWPYDLVIESSYCDSLKKEGKSKFFVEDNGSYVMGTVVGYFGKKFDKVVVAYMNPYEYKKPIYKTFDEEELILIDSPLEAITKIGKMKSVVDDLLHAVETETDKAEEEDPNGGGYLH